VVILGDVFRKSVVERFEVVLIHLLQDFLTGHPGSKVGGHQQWNLDGITLSSTSEFPHQLVGGIATPLVLEEDVHQVTLQLTVDQFGSGTETCHDLAFLRLVPTDIEEVLMKVLVINDDIVGQPPLPQLLGFFLWHVNIRIIRAVVEWLVFGVVVCHNNNVVIS